MSMKCRLMATASGYLLTLVGPTSPASPARQRPLVLCPYKQSLASALSFVRVLVLSLQPTNHGSCKGSRISHVIGSILDEVRCGS